MSKDFSDRLQTEWKPEFVISSGSLLLDNSDALSSYNGIPSGSICHYFSPVEGSYKTSMALQGLANVQKQGHKVAFVDAECALIDISWVEGMGVETTEDKWSLLIPESGEEACDMVEWLLEQGYKGIVVDSIDAMTPAKQLESEFGDACVTPETEILTTKGFVRFDKLKENDLVAQYDDGVIEYIKPTKIHKYKYNGKLTNYFTDYGIDLTVTPNHDMVWKRGRKNKITKIKSFDKLPLRRTKAIHAGLKTTGNDKLTPEEKLLIAFQADGNRSEKSRHRNGLYFSFKKERKIKKFLALMEEGKFEYKEIKDREGYRRFVVHYPYHITKDLRSYFNIENISYKKARLILDEAVQWDGCTIRCFRFDSTNEKVIDFFQELTTIAGYRSIKSKAYDDNHKKNWKALYRLSVNKKFDDSHIANLKKKEVDYNGHVYCAEVPSGMIVVRNNGKVVITGNSIGTHAKLITRFVRRLKNLVVKHNAIVWLVNQEKTNMTQMGARGTKPTGGSAIMFYSKFNLQMRRTKSDNQLEGQKTIPLKLGVKRSKLGHSYIDVDTYAVQGVGIDMGGELVQMAQEKGIIRKAGSWWKVGDKSIGQRIEQARNWCLENKELIL